jgi:guanylate kinase
MDKIVCLVGESGCGKSSVAEILEKDGYNYILSYTDRKKRNINEKGHIFIGVSYETWLSMHKDSEIIAETFFDKHHYWSIKEQYKNKGVSIYTVDPKGVRDLKKLTNDAEIIAIYLKCDEINRISRMEKDNRALDSINDRIENDREAFRIVECDYVVDANKELEDVVKAVREVIKLS